MQWLQNGYQFLLFIHNDKPQRYSLSRVDLLNGEVESLVADLPMSFFSPGLSPDKRYVAFHAWAPHGDEWYFDLATDKLKRLPENFRSFGWTQDSQHLFSVKRTDDDQVTLSFYNLRTEEITSVFLPDGTYERSKLDVNFDYLEIVKGSLYYRYQDSNTRYALYRYDLKSGALVEILPAMDEWDWVHIVGRKGNRWLVQLENEDEQRKVSDLKYLIVKSVGANLPEK